MKRNIFEFGNGYHIAINLDKVVAVDIKKKGDEWGLRIFINDLNNIYNLTCASAVEAEELYNDIVKAMKEDNSKEI